MKANLWRCYQCDVPTGCIKNLRILCTRKIGCICTCKKCATTTRKIFLFFFRVGPPGLPIIFFFLGGPARAPHSGREPASLSRKLFLFFI